MLLGQIMRLNVCYFESPLIGTHEGDSWLAESCINLERE